MGKGSSVFVGNIDFDVNEQKIVEELGTVGKVVSFRMVYDKATGRSKGYGFCEYESPLIAEAAMKTLRISFNGRPVKINYAENDMPMSRGREEEPARPYQMDNILQVLDTMNTRYLREVMEYFKKMAENQPSQLNELLDQNPKLVVALLWMLAKLELVDENELKEMIARSFDVDQQQELIENRIRDMKEDRLPEDVRNRIVRLKELLSKRE